MNHDIPPSRRQNRFAIVAAVLVAVLAVTAAMFYVSGFDDEPTSAPAIFLSPSDATETAMCKPVKPGDPDFIAVYGSAWPGSDEGWAELSLAKRLCVNAIISYSGIDGRKADLKPFFLEAKRQETPYIISLKDLYTGAEPYPDADPAMEEFHRQFGKSRDEQALGFVEWVNRDPELLAAVGGWLIADDEPPYGLDELGNSQAWVSRVQDRYRDIKRLSRQPVYVNIDEAGLEANGSAYAQACDILSVDFYPVPNRPMSDVTNVSRRLAELKPGRTMYVAQGGGWKNDPVTAEALDQPRDGRDPNAQEISDMLLLAHKAGARQLAVFSLDWLTSPQAIEAAQTGIAQYRQNN